MGDNNMGDNSMSDNNAEMWQGQNIVNCHDYPIHDNSSAERAALVSRYRQQLDENLYCSLPNFIRPAALQAMAAEAKTLRSKAYDNRSRRNCYLQRSEDASLPDNHPRNIMQDASTRMIAYHLLPQNSPLKTFYHWPAVRELLADIVGNQPLYDNEDLYQPANYVCYNDGDQSSWHFDSDNAFTVTLMVQPAERGGNFELSANTRSDADQNYDHVAKVLLGEADDTVQAVGREAGELCIFRGCHSLHRVSQVAGDTMRIMGVFVYESAPGVVGNAEVNETVYGIAR